MDAASVFSKSTYFLNPCHRSCAEFYGVKKSSLQRFIKNPGQQFVGKGSVSKVLSKAEEKMIADHLTERMQIGCGLDLLQLRYIIRDCIVAAIEANPERTSPWGEVKEGKEHLLHLPTERYIRKFLMRNKLTLRRSMPIHNGRAVCTVEDLRSWQDLTGSKFLSDPELTAAINDPNRVFNQDETSLSPGKGCLSFSINQ